MLLESNKAYSYYWTWVWSWKPYLWWQQSSKCFVLLSSCRLRSSSSSSIIGQPWKVFLYFLLFFWDFKEVENGASLW